MPRSGRLEQELLDRFEALAVRALKVAGELEAKQRPRRIVDQLVGAGTSPGAQVHEADAALSDRDFIKCLGIATKELAECRYWLRVISKMEWVTEDRLTGLLDEVDQLTRISHTIIIRTRSRPRPRRSAG